MRGRLLIAWFGPRGLSSLLLILLPGFAGLPGSEQLFAICSLVVLVSVVLHGGSPMLLSRAARKRALKEAGETSIDPPFGIGSVPTERRARIAGQPPNDEQPALPGSYEDSSTLSDGHKGSASALNTTSTSQPGQEAGSVEVGRQRNSLACGRARKGTRSQQGGMARRLLCLNERSDQRPCGAGTQRGRISASTRSYRRLDGVAGSRPAGRGATERAGSRILLIHDSRPDV
jgi:hypothetical protein